VGHRRDVHGGTVCAGEAGGSCGRQEPASGGPGVWAGAEDGWQDAGVSLPPGYQRQKPIRRPKLGPWQGVIDTILADDKARPSKQRHTAKRIFERLRAEYEYAGGYTIVKDYVRQSKVGGQEMLCR